MDYGEFTKNMTTFAPTPIQNASVALRFLLQMVEHMRSTIQITTPYDVFGVQRKCYIMIESLKDFISMRPKATAFLDAYIINHWTLVVINLTKGAAFWIDPLKNCIDPDVTEVVERSFNIMKKKKLNWRVVKCAKQSGVVECGYYVMRFMRDIILSRSTSIIHIMKDSPRAYTQDDIDCIRSEWVEFVSLWAEFGVCDYVFLKCVSLWAEFGVCDYVFLKCVCNLVLLKCVVDHEVLLKCLLDHEILLKCVADHEVLLKCVVDHEVNVMCLCG
ncbi:hypothetical protein IC582_007396 [Cucumis melo]